MTISSRLVGLAASTLVIGGFAAPAPAAAIECSETTVRGVRIIELTDALGCNAGADLASRTVRHDGFLQTDVYDCRWGQGGTTPVKRHGKIFYSGFCLN